MSARIRWAQSIKVDWANSANTTILVATFGVIWGSILTLTLKLVGRVFGIV
jgi:hypothetical protein